MARRTLSGPVGILSATLVILLTSSVACGAVLPKSRSTIRVTKHQQQATASVNKEINNNINNKKASNNAKRLLQYTPEALRDRVTSLPGWGEIDGFNMFAGYITVDERAGRALFYIHVESSGDPDSDPLVLWLNGGPGCSSVGGGFMAELGPFFPLPGGRKLQVNPHSWSQVANMLFVESPAFVGFSYSNSTSDMIVGDKRTADDSYHFMLGFLQRFPHLAQREFYLSGESYAGHYVPNLALAIVKGNEAAAKSHPPGPHVPLVGFLVGNPWTDAAIDNLGAVDFWWAHALISDETALGIRSNCNFSRIGPLDYHKEHLNPQSREEQCDDYCNRAFDELGNINIYHIYADVCNRDDDEDDLKTDASSDRVVGGPAAALARALGAGNPVALAARVAAAKPGSLAGLRMSRLAAATAAAAGATAKEADAAATAVVVSRRLLQDGGDDGGKTGGAGGREPGYDPCVDDEVDTYLNLPEVQAALHANQTHKLPGKWHDCTHAITYSREDLLSSMLPVYDQLLGKGLRMLIYSGDVDGIVPVVGTRRWVAGLRLKTKSAWRPWESDNGQVGGYVVDYDGLTFATVRGAGHMVPYTQAERGLHLFQRFITKQEL